jgi:hypothetical protein
MIRHSYNEAIQRATGDVLFWCDLDWSIHENDFAELRGRVEVFDKTVLTMPKCSVYINGGYFQKNEEKVCLNLKYRDKVLFGIKEGGGSEVCELIWKTNKTYNSIPEGQPVNDVFRTGVTLWNFDFTFKDMETCKREIMLLSLARWKAFGETDWGKTPEDAWNFFLFMMRGRVRRCNKSIGKDYSKLPKYIREKYRNLKPEQFGFNGFGFL